MKLGFKRNALIMIFLEPFRMLMVLNHFEGL